MPYLDWQGRHRGLLVVCGYFRRVNVNNNIATEGSYRCVDNCIRD